MVNGQTVVAFHSFSLQKLLFHIRYFMETFL